MITAVKIPSANRRSKQSVTGYNCLPLAVLVKDEAARAHGMSGSVNNGNAFVTDRYYLTVLEKIIGGLVYAITLKKGVKAV